METAKKIVAGEEVPATIELEEPFGGCVLWWGGPRDHGTVGESLRSIGAVGHLLLGNVSGEDPLFQLNGGGYFSPATIFLAVSIRVSPKLGGVLHGAVHLALDHSVELALGGVDGDDDDVLYRASVRQPQWPE